MSLCKGSLFYVTTVGCHFLCSCLWYQGRSEIVWTVTSCEIARVTIGQCSLSAAFRHQMAIVLRACEKLLSRYQV
jgi:hypothetical protein